MRIVIVGAGEVGSYVAERLSREGLDVVVIELDPTKLSSVERNHDVQTILGNGTHPEVLAAAGADEADLLVAVTSVDSVNLLACLVGKQLGVDRAIARIEAANLRGRRAQKIHKAVGADQVIDPDDAVANDILNLLAYPGASEVQVLGNGEVIMITAELTEDAPLTGATLKDIGAMYEPEWEFIVGTITRGDQSVIPRSDHTLHAGDSVRVLCKRKARSTVTKLLGLERGTYRRVMLLGGGRTAERLARLLAEQNNEVSLVERDEKRARQLAAELDGVLVLQGDITDARMLEDENVAHQDAVVALTGDDDANILACLYAKSMGASETISVLHRLELRGLLHEVGIDVALSPRTASANAVLRHVRGGVTQVATSLDSDIEVFEVEVERRSRAENAEIRDMGLPRDSLVAAIVRDGNPQIGRAWSTLRLRDHVVIVARPECAAHVRELFARPE